MKQFTGGVAVVTGGASGIGRALAQRFAEEGMKVVLADIEQGALDTAERELLAAGHDIVAVRTDVSSRASVDELAAATLDRYGAPNILCNNAGVAGGGQGPVWQTTEKDWEWVVGVNLLGVVHGIQSFLPHMVESGQPGHVVNTSSIYGLMSGGPVIYGVTKHGVVRLSEGLWSDLKAAGAPIGVSVLCPGLIATRIVSSGRNRPEHLRNDDDPKAAEQFRAAAEQRFMENGMPPADVAGIVIDAIRQERFYVLTHPDMKRMVEQRFNAILDGSTPPETIQNRRTS